MAGFISRITQQTKNTLQRTEYERLFTQDSQLKKSVDIDNCEYPQEFSGRLLINWAPIRNAQTKHQLWEIEDNMATSNQMNEHKNSDENDKIIMQESDRILFEDGYKLQRCRSLFLVTLKWNKEDKMFQTDEIKKVLNGWLRFVADIDCEENNQQLYVFSGREPVSEETLYIPLSVKVNQKQDSIVNVKCCSNVYNSVNITICAL